MERTDDWARTIATTCLRASHLDLDRPFLAERLCEAMIWTLHRAIPKPDKWIVLETESDPSLLILRDRALYRGIVRLNEDAANGTTIEIERIDLERRTKSVTLAEHQHMDEGKDLLESRWLFEFDAAEPLEIKHSQGNPEDSPAGRPYQFAQAVADAAGWTKPA